jgi:uncharacterized glyoxalase superfamily protein PhnB
LAGNCCPTRDTSWPKAGSTAGRRPAAPLAEGRQHRWLEVRPPGGQTAITLVLADETMRAGSMKGMILRASDLDATVAELTGRGVSMPQEIQQTPWASYVSFEDPDGNSWMIQEPRRDR